MIRPLCQTCLCSTFQMSKKLGPVFFRKWWLERLTKRMKGDRVTYSSNRSSEICNLEIPDVWIWCHLDDHASNEKRKGPWQVVFFGISGNWFCHSMSLVFLGDEMFNTTWRRALSSWWSSTRFCWVMFNYTLENKRLEPEKGPKWERKNIWTKPINFWVQNVHFQGCNFH